MASRFYTETVANAVSCYVQKWLDYADTAAQDIILEDNLWRDGTAFSPESRLIALLTMFGDAINIYRKDSQGDFKPVSLEGSALVNPCQTP